MDGRSYPWGDYLDPSWCNMRESRSDRALPAVVESYPIDVSVYGVRGMAGNTTDWCQDVYRKEGPAVIDERLVVSSGADDELAAEGAGRVLRGGSWDFTDRGVRAAYRCGHTPGVRFVYLGLRLIRGPVSPASAAGVGPSG